MACGRAQTTIRDALKRRRKPDCSTSGFLPSTEISRLFPPEEIQIIIGCSCKVCKNYRNFIRYGRDELKLRDLAQQIYDRAISLFALLCDDKKGVLTIHYLRFGWSDQQVLDSLTRKESDFTRNAFQEFIEEKGEELRISTQDLDRVDDHIERNWTSFLRPSIGDVPFRVFSKRCVLPIYDDQPIGRGGFGKVFAFKIYDGYNKIGSLKGENESRVLARKQLDIKDMDEINTLLEMKELNDPHIVKILAAFEYENQPNLVFLKSDTNLRLFLRNRDLGLGQSNYSNIFDAPIWEQTWGIVNALSRIHRREDKIVFHGDLKPDNILVNLHGHKFQFLIADFGSSIKHNPSSGSKEYHAGGDPGYGPPEGRDRGRRCDIWCMGCIIMEILLFVVRGFAGPLDLDAARGTEDRRFWQRDEDRLPLVKPQIKGLLNQIKHETNSQRDMFSHRGKRFVLNMVELVEKMLSVRPETRPKSFIVANQLRKIQQGTWHGPQDQDADDEVVVENEGLANRQASPVVPVFEEEEIREGSDVISDFQVGEPLPDEEEVQRETMKKMRSLLARLKHYPQREVDYGRFQIFKRTHRDRVKLRFVFSPFDGTVPLEYTASQDSLSLIPAYALRKSHNEARRDLAGLRLIRDDDLEDGMQYNLDGNLEDLRVVHGILMKQSIRHSAVIQSLEIDIYQGGKLARMFPKFPTKTQNIICAGTTTVQIWCDDRKDRPQCRLVFYFDNNIIIMEFTENLGFANENENPWKEEPVLPSYINKGANSAKFSVIETQDLREQPALYVDQLCFQQQCSSKVSNLRSIKMRFDSVEHRRHFLEVYKPLKARWREDYIDSVG